MNTIWLTCSIAYRHFIYMLSGLFFELFKIKHKVGKNPSMKEGEEEEGDKEEEKEEKEEKEGGEGEGKTNNNV